MLPGPAREMHPMFEEQVVPRLQKGRNFSGNRLLHSIANCRSRGIHPSRNRRTHAQ